MTKSVPKLYFTRTHIETGLTSEDTFSSKNCPGFYDNYLKHLELLARHRLGALNTKMPDQWKYELIGWKLDNKEHQNEAL